MMEWRFWIGTGACTAGLSVLLGAFGAHALKGTLDDQQIQWFKTAFEYHAFHSLALLILGLLASRTNNSLVQSSGWFFCLGIVLFSGSLYLMALGFPKTLAIITPIGGLSFLTAWTLMAIATFKKIS